MRRRTALVGLAGLANGIGPVWADATAAIGAALDRPSLPVRDPAHAVLLAAAAAGARWVAVGERGLVLLSPDPSHSWQQVASPVSVTLTSVRFADDRNGFAVGHGGTVLVTADGGRSWARRLDGRQIAALLIVDAKARNDVVALKSAEQFAADGPDKPLLDVLVSSPQRALVIGAYGLALGTEDGGKTWTPWTSRLDNPKGLHLYAVRQRGERMVIAGEQGLVLRSNDGGRTFHRLTPPYEGSYFALELPSAQEIVVAGLGGNVWHSANDGAVWEQWPVPMAGSIIATQQAVDGTLYFANQAGYVLTRRGGALLPLNVQPMPPLSGLATGRDGQLLALTSQGAMVVPIIAKQ